MKKRPAFSGAVPVRDLTLIGMMAAVIEVSKMALSFLPNIELTSFWLIMFTLFFGRRVFLVVPVFLLVEGCIYGFGLWWAMYLYVWPLLVLIVWILRRYESVWFWSILSGVFGLCFGLLCSVPYVIIGAADGLRHGLYAGFSWWVAGIPWDIGHCAGNFVLMLVMFRPIKSIMGRIKRNDGEPAEY